MLPPMEVKTSTPLKMDVWYVYVVDSGIVILLTTVVNGRIRRKLVPEAWQGY